MQSFRSENNHQCFHEKNTYKPVLSSYNRIDISDSTLEYSGGRVGIPDLEISDKMVLNSLKSAYYGH